VRLFIAVNLPEHEKARLAEILDVLRTTALPVRWVQRESLHITLKFLGEVPERQVAEIAAANERVADRCAPFELEVGGFGTFPSRTRPRVFWIGVATPPQLVELQELVEENIEPLGYPREKRAFHPHLTLGRVKSDAGKLDSAAVDRILSSLVYKAVVRVDSIDLMRSHLSPRGARYERIHAANLGRGV
jgi:2'-5' RNA ligase